MKQLFVFFSVFLTITYFSCSKKVITRNYYVLEFPETKSKVTSEKPLVDASCEIFAVSIPPAFAQSRIAIRKRSHEIGYYQNHLWAVPPGDLIAQLVESYIQKENIFNKVSQSIWKEVPLFRIRISVSQIEAMYIDDELFSHIKMKLDLFNRSENYTVVSHQFDRKEMLEEKDINLLAISLSRILEEELQVFSTKIKSDLTQ